MSSDNNSKVYLNREEQLYLMEMLEISNPEMAVLKFSEILASEGVDSSKLSTYLKKIMNRIKNA